jgi:hypothetical protein
MNERPISELVKDKNDAESAMTKILNKFLADYPEMILHGLRAERKLTMGGTYIWGVDLEITVK